MLRNKQLRKDPHEEFFYLTFLSTQICEKGTSLPLDKSKLFKEAQDRSIPFYLWNDWLKGRIIKEKAVKVRNHEFRYLENPTAELSLQSNLQTQVVSNAINSFMESI